MGAEGRGLLVDAGLPGREIERRMASAGLDPRRVAAVVVTHEHRDHVSGVGVWARRHKVPVHIAWETLEAMRAGPFAGLLDRVEVIPFAAGECFEAAGIEVAPFATSHDAARPVGLRLCGARATLGIATDLGAADEGVRAALAGADFLFLESNHDERMLAEGPYPRFLKERIRSGRGHLSNADSARLLAALVHPGLRSVVLGHLSEVNNEPLLAFRAARAALDGAGAGEDVTLLVARQDRPGRVVRR